MCDDLSLFLSGQEGHSMSHDDCTTAEQGHSMGLEDPNMGQQDQNFSTPQPVFGGYLEYNKMWLMWEHLLGVQQRHPSVHYTVRFAGLDF